jgi:uncharacterized protein (TIGR03437 family)
VFLAHPPRYWAFKQWTTTMHTAPIPNPTLSLVVDRPLLVIAEFTPATLVSFATEPAGLQIMIDRSVVPTPFIADWAYGSTHTFFPVTPQYDPQGGPWAFEGWTDGGPENRTYTASHVRMNETFTARFKPAVRFGFNTDPVGLKLMVDGLERSHYNFLWPVGARHTVAAPAEQTDASGRQYLFNSWSNGGPAEQQVTVVGDWAGMVARYDPLGRLTILSYPASAAITVDGQPCTTPCDVQRRAGEQVTIVAPASVTGEDGSRLDFQSWSDGGPAERTWTATAAAQTITANFGSKFRLNATSNPPGAATFRYEPPSPDGYFPPNTEVTVTVEPNRGYRLRHWDGDLNGIQPTGRVSMSQPRTIVAVLERLDVYGPAAVRSAAGETPDGLVAPGSMITIYGEAIAPRFEQGPESPLAQTLAGITVQVGDRFLPLAFVSPERIDAQLPSDLGEGEYELVVHYDGLADIAAKFKLARNAPGLFAETIDNRAFAMALHEDGSRITPQSPARRGETITLLGTGFGPYKTGAIDGFAVPQGMVLELEDAIELRAGDQVLQPAATPQAAVGKVGTIAVKLRIADPLPINSTIELRVVQNGRSSNTVLLPLK